MQTFPEQKLNKHEITIKKYLSQNTVQNKNNKYITNSYYHENYPP